MELRFQTSIPSEEQFWNLFQTTGWNEAFRLPPDRLIEAARASWFVLCVYDGDQLVGFGRLTSDTVMHAMIYDLIVVPEYQGKGIGAQILERLVEHCRTAGVYDVQLFCAYGKRGFYEKFGFTARPRGAPGMQLVISHRKFNYP